MFLRRAPFLLEALGARRRHGFGVGLDLIAISISGFDDVRLLRRATFLFEALGARRRRTLDLEWAWI